MTILTHYYLILFNPRIIYFFIIQNWSCTGNERLRTYVRWKLSKVWMNSDWKEVMIKVDNFRSNEYEWKSCGQCMTSSNWMKSWTTMTTTTHYHLIIA